MFGAAAFAEKLDEKEHEEGGKEHGRGDGGGAFVVELLEFGDDEDRENFRFSGDISRDENDRAVLADAAGERHGEAAPESGSEAWEEDVKKRACAAGTEEGGGFLEVFGGLFEDGLQGANDEGKPDKDEGDDDADGGEDELDAAGLGPLPNPAVAGAELGEGDASDGGGQGEGEVDQAVEEFFARKIITAERPSEEQTEGDADEGGDGAA